MVTGIGDRPRFVCSYGVEINGSVAGVEAAGEVAFVLLVFERVVEKENGLENFDDGVCVEELEMCC